MKWIPATLFLLHAVFVLPANPFLGRWDCTEVDNTRLRMTFQRDMTVRIERRQAEEVQEVTYAVNPEAPLITINGTLFYYLFTDDDHFVLYPDMSEFIYENAGKETVRSLLLSMFQSHYLYTGRRVR